MCFDVVFLVLSGVEVNKVNVIVCISLCVRALGCKIRLKQKDMHDAKQVGHEITSRQMLIVFIFFHRRE